MHTPTITEKTNLQQFVTALPKTELHVHIEGTLEPELIFKLATRNKITLPHESIQNLKDAYEFTNLQSFLNLYYAGTRVLITEQDFYDMAIAYLQRAHADGVLHVEIMFDPQTHTARGIAIETVFAGLARALREMQKTRGLTGYLLLSFLRHLPEQDALDTLKAALPLRDQYQDLWIGIGLDSAEQGNPPEKFARVFKQCKELGFRLVAHAGEEGPASYICDALDLLHAQRIDHGVRCEEDPNLVQRLIQQQTPLTVCPLSNLKLCVVNDLRNHNLARLLRSGVAVTINSDDPAYFGGYIVDNYLAVAKALTLSRSELAQLAKNSIVASFLPATQKQALLNRLASYLQQTRTHSIDTATQYTPLTSVRNSTS